MRRKSATLFARYRSSDDPARFDRVAVKFDARGRAIRPKIPISYFQVMWRDENGQRKTSKVGTDLLAAVNALNNYRGQIAAGQQPEPVTANSLPSSPSAAISTDDDSISELLDAWIRQTKEQVEQHRMSNKTLLAYRLAADYFKAFCAEQGITALADIRNAPANDLKHPHPIVRFEKWLCGKNGISFNEPAKKLVSIANNFRFLNVFFQMQGIKLFKGKKNSLNDPGLLPWNQRPAQPDYDSEEYEVKFFSADDLTEFRKYAKPQKKEEWVEFADGTASDLVEFLVHTGFRKSEVAHVEWSDMDWTGKELQKKPSDPKRPSIKIGVKPPSNSIPRGFRTKNGKTRRIPIVNLASVLKARFERMQKAGVSSTLIFPNQSGFPNTHLDEIINEIAGRAKKSGAHFSEGGFGLHRFRKTYATTLLDAGVNLRTIQLRLGHSKFETTERYLGKSTVSGAEDAAFD